MLMLDLHLHTTFSDGKLPPGKLVDLCGKAGFDAISITDHLCPTNHLLGKSAQMLKYSLTSKNWKDYWAELEKQQNRAWREYKMIVFKGIEFSRNTFTHKKNAHILAIDVKDFISPEQTEEAWLREAKNQGALTVAAHPLKLPDASSQTYYLLENWKRYHHLIDLWETANARTFWRQMLKTPFNLIASSDLHISSRWPAWRTEIPCMKDPDAIKSYLLDRCSPRNFVFVYGTRDEVKHRVHYKRKEAGHDPVHNGFDVDDHLFRIHA